MKRIDKLLKALEELSALNTKTTCRALKEATGDPCVDCSLRMGRYGSCLLTEASDAVHYIKEQIEQGGTADV